jgi:hypothetical protein
MRDRHGTSPARCLEAVTGRSRALDGDRWAQLGLLGVVLFLHRGALVSGGVIYKRDVHLVWLPQVEGFVRAVASGSWPVWDPCPSFGQPLLADASAQILYPLTWLNLMMRPWTYYAVFSVLHALLSSIGAYRLVRHLGASSSGGFVAGALWILSGPFLSLVDLWHHYASSAWIPWVFLAALRVLEAPSPRRIGVCGGAVALQILAGSADLCAMTLLGVLFYGLAFSVNWRSPLGAGNLRLAAAIGAAVALGIGISSALWMSALDLAFRTPRWNLPDEVRTYWSVHPLTVLEILFPQLWSGVPLAPSLRQALFESREPFLASLYVGVPTLALAAGGIALQPSRLRTFWLGIGAGAVLVSLGRHFFVYELALFLLPPLRILRYPVKALVLAAFAAALLAGLGFDAWREGGVPQRRRWLWYLLVPFGLVTVAGLTAALVIYSDTAAWRPPLLSAAGLAAVCALIGMARARAASPNHWAAALAVLAIGDLGLFHRNAIPLAPRALYTYRPPIVDALREMGAARLYVYDYTRREENLRWLKREVGYRLASVPVGWNLDQAAALGMQQALAPATAGRWAFPSGFEIDYRGLQPEGLARLVAAMRGLGPEARLRLLRLGEVTHVVALHAEGFEGLVPAGAWETVLVDRVLVFGVPDPWPRARIVPAARVADDAEGLRLLVDPAFDPTQEVVLATGSSSSSPPSPADTIRIVEERSDRLALETDLSRPAYALLADAFDPGWRASIDGASVPLLRANLAFRAVRAPAGRHRIEMVYRPTSLRIGLALSAASLLAALALVAPRSKS